MHKYIWTFELNNIPPLGVELDIHINLYWVHCYRNRERRNSKGFLGQKAAEIYLKEQVKLHA